MFLRHCVLRSLGALSLFVGAVWADGFYISDRDVHLTEPQQKAVIAWDGHREEMLISSSVQADGLSNFVWIVPLKSSTKPETKAGDISVFEGLADYFAPPEPPDGIILAGPIEVVESKEIDVYDVTVLEAKDSNALAEWLSKAGYTLPGAAKPVLQQYIQDGFSYFVINKLDLRNKYAAAMDQVEPVYARGERRLLALQEEINLEFAKLGIKERLVAESWRGQTEVMLLNHLNSPENPLGLPREPPVEVGAGLTLIDYTRVLPLSCYMNGAWDPPSQFCDEPFLKTGWRCGGDTGHRAAVYRKGIFVGLIAYDMGNERYRYQHDIDSLHGRGSFSDAEAAALSEFFSTWKYGAQGKAERLRTCDEKIAAFCKETGIELLKKLREYAALGDLLTDGSARGDFWRKSRALARDSSNPRRLLTQDVPAVPFKELFDTIEKLAAGLGTPLKFTVSVSEPYYPLRISSLADGSTNIELYYLGSSSSKDRSGMLSVEPSKSLDSPLRERLEKYFNISKLKMATRMSFKGSAASLNKDAVF